MNSWFKKDKRKRKVPFKTQLSNDDCGASCLSMILGYYNYDTSVSSCSKTLENHGVQAQIDTLAKAASYYKMDTNIVSSTVEELKEKSMPCVIHWNFNHYVVLEKITDEGFFIVDPAIGFRKITLEQFNVSYTGILLELSPTPEFNYGYVEKDNAFRQFLIDKLVTGSNIRLFLSLLALSGLLQIAALAYPALTLYFVDTVIPYKLENLTTLVMISLIFLALHVGFLNYVRAVIIVRFQSLMDKTLVSGFLDKLLKLPLSFHKDRSSGDIQGRLNSHTAIRSFFSTYTLTSLIDFITVISYSIFLAFISVEIAMLTIIIALAILMTQFVYNRALREKSHAELKTQSSYQAYLIEILSGIEFIKGSSSETEVMNNWNGKLKDYIMAIENKGLLDAKAVSMTRTIEVMAPALIFSYSIMQYFTGHITLGIVIAANSICIMALSPISSLLNHIRVLQMVKAHINRISELWLHEEETFGDLPLPEDLNSAQISFVDVTFRHKKNNQLVLNNLNLTLDMGQKIAIVGPSGSGKSTLLSLLIGLSRPTTGQILLNGIDFFQYDLTQLRQHVGFVSQSSFLFNASIKDNIAFGQHNIKVSEVQKIAQQLGLHDEISKLPMQYETLVGQSGGKLSGGQKQRLAIARALINSPDIIVLDEATSSLDSVNEALVSNVITSYGNTQLVVSHRMSTVTNSDLIIVLNNGEVEAIGTNEYLKEHNHFYQQCCNSQSENKLYPAAVGET